MIPRNVLSTLTVLLMRTLKLSARAYGGVRWSLIQCAPAMVKRIQTNACLRYEHALLMAVSFSYIKAIVVSALSLSSFLSLFLFVTL